MIVNDLFDFKEDTSKNRPRGSMEADVLPLNYSRPLESTIYVFRALLVSILVSKVICWCRI